MTILITGGAGYIGSHMVKVAINKGYDVVVVDNLSTGHVESIDPRARFYKGDISDETFMKNVLEKEKIDGVIHFAAFSLVGESMLDPHKYYQNNVGKTNELLNILVKNKINKIVFSSTAATYGEPKKTPILEDDEQNPTNVYGDTKLAIEKMLKWYDRAFGFKSVILRYFNVAGAYDNIGEAHNPETHLIPIILQVANKKRDYLYVYGNDYETKDGTCIRDYIHILDLCEAHILALEYLFKGNNSNYFNLGTENGFSVLEMIEAARKVTGKPIPVIITKRRDGDPAVLIASSKKAKEILKWNPQYSFIEKMIEDAYFWEMNKKY